MATRKTGRYVSTENNGETVRAFIPHPLPPVPPIEMNQALEVLLHDAEQSCRLLNLASKMIPNLEWFIYCFLRKEAVVSSQIEGTQATLVDVLEAEITGDKDRSPDIAEVANYVGALNFCLKELKKPKGLPLSLRLIKRAHELLMYRARGKHKTPGEFRRSQNWIGGSRPGTASFVPPPPDEMRDCLDEFEDYLHAEDGIHPLIRAGLLHVQFETIHPFLDGNGRVGRLLITVLLNEWKVLDSPLLYFSLHFKRTRSEYYDRLMAVRTKGDWEGWTRYFLEGINAIAHESADAARQLYEIFQTARAKIIDHKSASVVALRLMERLPSSPFVTIGSVTELLSVSKPTAQKAISLLVSLGILHEFSGRERDKRFAFKEYLRVLSFDTEPLKR